MIKGFNKFKNTPDNHDFMTPEHVSGFLRNHRTGVDNLGRRALATVISTSYPNATVIDAACGTCVNWEVFKNFNIQCNYIGVDRTEGMLSEARKRYPEIELVTGYVQELPFKENAVDIVIMRHILEHLQEGYEDAIREGLRVASKELIIVFFLDPSPDLEDDIRESDPDENGCTYFWNTYSWNKFMKFVSTLEVNVRTARIVTPGAAHADTIVRLIK